MERKRCQCSSRDEDDEFAFGVRALFTRAYKPFPVGFISLMLFGLGRRHMSVGRNICNKCPQTLYYIW